MCGRVWFEISSGVGCQERRNDPHKWPHVMVEGIGNFDEYVNSYSDELEKALGGFGGDIPYYARRKVAILVSSMKGILPSVIIDFGSGTGSLIPHLHDFFPKAQIIATDVSRLALRHIQNEYPYVEICEPEKLEPQSCDLIVMSCVIHHIPVDSRVDVLQKIHSALKTNGSLCIFEHNPINPVTRKIVSNCIFDEGVELITKKSLSKLIKKVGGFSQIKNGYVLFFPPALKYFCPLERVLYWLPLGGQHFARLIKNKE